MRAILDVLMLILNMATFIIFVQFIMSWLVSFNVLSIQNPTVRSIWEGLTRITEPFYRPIRNMMPQMGGLDFSPMILLIGIYFLKQVIFRYGYGAVPF